MIVHTLDPQTDFEEDEADTTITIIAVVGVLMHNAGMVHNMDSIT